MNFSCCCPEPELLVEARDGAVDGKCGAETHRPLVAASLAFGPELDNGEEHCTTILEPRKGFVNRGSRAWSELCKIHAQIVMTAVAPVSGHGPHRSMSRSFAKNGLSLTHSPRCDIVQAPCSDPYNSPPSLSWARPPRLLLRFPLRGRMPRGRCGRRLPRATSIPAPSDRTGRSPVGGTTGTATRFPAGPSSKWRPRGTRVVPRKRAAAWSVGATGGTARRHRHPGPLRCSWLSAGAPAAPSGTTARPGVGGRTSKAGRAPLPAGSFARSRKGQRPAAAPGS